MGKNALRLSAKGVAVGFIYDNEVKVILGPTFETAGNALRSGDDDTVSKLRMTVCHFDGGGLAGPVGEGFCRLPDKLLGVGEKEDGAKGEG